MCVTGTPYVLQLLLSKTHIPEDVDNAVSVISRLGQQIRTVLDRRIRHYFFFKRRKIISQRYSDILVSYPVLGYRRTKYHVNFTF